MAAHATGAAPASVLILKASLLSGGCQWRLSVHSSMWAISQSRLAKVWHPVPSLMQHLSACKSAHMAWCLRLEYGPASSALKQEVHTHGRVRSAEHTSSETAAVRWCRGQRVHRVQLITSRYTMNALDAHGVAASWSTSTVQILEMLVLIAAGAGAYVTAVQLARRKRRRALASIDDCRDLVQQIAAGDYAFLWNKSLEFALYRTFAIPGISKLLEVGIMNEQLYCFESVCFSSATQLEALQRLHLDEVLGERSLLHPRQYDIRLQTVTTVVYASAIERVSRSVLSVSTPCRQPRNSSSGAASAMTTQICYSWRSSKTHLTASAPRRELARPSCWASALPACYAQQVSNPSGRRWYARAPVLRLNYDHY